MMENLQVRWFREGGTDIDFAKQIVAFILGKRNSGKSALLEVLAELYLKHGAKIIDLFGAHDGEGLGWLRSPHVKENGKKVVLFHDEGTEIDSPYDTMLADDFTLSSLNKADIFVSAAPLYSVSDREFTSVHRIITELWNRHYWTEPIFLIVREAGNLLYSRLKISLSEKEAKAWYIYAMRESRHAGLSLGLDSLRPMSIDIDIRSLTDYTILKNLGSRALPREMWWIYKTIAPEQMARLKQNEFVIIDDGGNIGIGMSGCPRWHKLENENIMKEVGIKVNYTAAKLGRG